MARETLPTAAYVPQEAYGVTEDGRPTMANLVGDPRYMRARPEGAAVGPRIDADGNVVTRYVFTDRQIDEQILRIYERDGSSVSRESYYAEIKTPVATWSRVQQEGHEMAHAQQRSANAPPAANVKAMPEESGEVSSKDL